MKNHEKSSLIKFTLIYFLTTGMFVVVLGYLYFYQQKHLILKQTATDMFQYSELLAKTDFKHPQEGFSYSLEKNQKVAFEFPQKIGKDYVKAFPTAKKEGYIVVYREAKDIDAEIYKVKILTVSLQVALLLTFLVLSYFLAKQSLRPMKEVITHLDRFVLDLIHDLNTPATSILLNTNLLLDKENDPKKQKRLNRIVLGADTISSLYKNLELLLDHKLEKENINLTTFIEHKAEDFKMFYPKITFDVVMEKNCLLYTNKKAISRILDNLLVNSCKYSNEESPKIWIKFANNCLSIEDNGKGVKYPQKIFERTYKENELGHGIGMHIVHRLCDSLNISIFISSKENIGTNVMLCF